MMQNVKLLIIYVLILSPLSSIGQERIDSLKRRLFNEKSEEIRVRLNNEISSAYLKINYDSSFFYAEKAANLASKIGSEEGVIASLISKIKLSNQSKNFQQTRQLLNDLLERSTKHGSRNGLANYYLYSGLIFQYELKIDSAFNSFLLSKKEFESTNDKFGRIQVLNFLGALFYSQEEYKKAIVYYLMALSVAESSKMSHEKANCFINVANVLNAQLDYEKAISYLEKALDIFIKNNDKYNIGVCLNNIAANYIGLKNFVKAIDFLDRSLLIYQELNNKNGQAACFTNRGIVFSENYDNESALISFKSALRINEELKDKYRVLGSMLNISISNLKLGNYNESIAISLEGIDLADKLKALSLKVSFYENLAIAYDSLKDFRASLNYFKVFKALNDSLVNIDKKIEVLELEKKYTNKIRDAEINNLKKANELKAVTINNNQIILISLLILFLFLIIILVVYYRLYNLKVRSAKLLSDKNSQLNLVNYSLQQSENKFKELNATKDKFFTIIAHDIRNPLNGFRSILKLLTRNYYSLDERLKLDYIQRIERSSDNLNVLFQNLLQWSTSQAGTIQFKPIEIDLGVLILRSIAILEEDAKRKQIRILTFMPDELLVFGDINMISVVIVNLISNAIKYSHTNSIVEIRFNYMNGFVVLRIEDHGIGIEKSDLERLFDVSFDHKTIGNSEEKGTGIGLILCKEFILRNNGKIWAESEINIGSTFYISLPVNDNNTNSNE